MNDFLYALLNNELDLQKPDRSALPHYHDIQRARDKQFQKIVAALGMDFADEVWNLAGDAACIAEDQAFERGFRTAGRLLLSMLS